MHPLLLMLTDEEFGFLVRAALTFGVKFPSNLTTLSRVLRSGANPRVTRRIVARIRDLRIAADVDGGNLLLNQEVEYSLAEVLAKFAANSAKCAESGSVLKKKEGFSLPSPSLPPTPPILTRTPLFPEKENPPLVPQGTPTPSAPAKAKAKKANPDVPLFPEVYAELLAVRQPNGKPIPRRDATTSTRLARAWNKAIKKAAPEKIVEAWKGYAALVHNDLGSSKALSAWLNDDRFLCDNFGWRGKMNGNSQAVLGVSTSEAERAESERLARLMRERDARIEAEMRKAAL